MALNQITLMGRFTRDPELRYTQSNTAVSSFTLAVERDRKADGDKGTDFIDCVAWGQTGEFVSKYFQKGSMAVVSGRLQIREWTDKNDNKRRTAEVVVENIYFGESKRDNTNGSGRYAPDNDYPPASFAELDEDGDLPF